MTVNLLNRYALPVAVSAGLHTLVIAAMLAGWSPEPLKKELKRPNYVQAQLVQLEAQAQPVAKPSAPQPKIVDLTQKQKELERQQQQAEQKRKLELERKQEADRKKEAERKKREQERKAKDKAEAERKAKEKAAAERKAKEEAESKKQELARKQQEQQAFEQALAQEEMRLQEESYATAAQSYISIIAQRIEQNWSRPPSARSGMEAELLIKLVPTGRVISVDVIKSSGNALFDRSAVQAVHKAEQFPIIKEMQPEVFERYYRELNLVFRPQDLRQ